MSEKEGRGPPLGEPVRSELQGVHSSSSAHEVPDQEVEAYSLQDPHPLCTVLSPLQTYVLKLAKSGSDGEKVFLLLESGSRFHTVQASALFGASPCQQQ